MAWPFSDIKNDNDDTNDNNNSNNNNSTNNNDGGTHRHGNSLCLYKIKFSYFVKWRYGNSEIGRHDVVCNVSVPGLSLKHTALFW